MSQHTFAKTSLLYLVGPPDRNGVQKVPCESHDLIGLLVRSSVCEKYPSIGSGSHMVRACFI